MPTKINRFNRVSNFSFGVLDHDHPLSFYVESQSREGWHFVELDAFKGNGECSCEDFRFNKLPLWRMLKTASDLTRCKHIKACRRHLLDKVIDKLKRTERERG